MHQSPFPQPPDRRSPWREGGIAVAVFLVCLLGGALRDGDTIGLPTAQAYLLAGVSGALTLARHRAPTLTLVAATACGMLVAPLGLLPTPLTVAATAVGAYALAATTRPGDVPGARTFVVVLCAALLVFAVALREVAFSWADVSRWAIVAATPLVAAVLGRTSSHRRAYLALVEERARRAEESRDDEARRKVAEERVRIARELHDLVAHQITLANAQATVAVHLFNTHPDQARAHAADLVATTRQALDELRATVGLLRERDGAVAPAEPAPGLEQLPSLLDSFGRAGLAVEVTSEGSAAVLPPSVDLTAHRIIQEALTNVTKHSGAASARVRLAWGADDLTVTVADDGAGSPAPGRRPGYGLIGMRERATAVGGSLAVGPRPGGGFQVVAVLPLSRGEAPAQPEPTQPEPTQSGPTPQTRRRRHGDQE